MDRATIAGACEVHVKPHTLSDRLSRGSDGAGL